MHQRLNRRGSALLVCLCAVVLPSPAFAQADEAEWGTLRGRFVYDGQAPEPARLEINKDVDVCGPHMLTDESLLVDENGGLRNVVIYVRTKNPRVHPMYDEAAEERMLLDNAKCRFEPHIQVVRLSQTFVLHNSDSVSHNANVQPVGDTPINVLIPPEGEVEHAFRRELVIPATVQCNVHPWMKGYVVVRDHPYATVSAADGTFVLENLPAGELDFQVWHERSGYLEALPEWKKGKFALQIVAGDNDLGDVTCAPELFEK